MRRTILKAALALVALPVMLGFAHAQGTLRIAMTAADIPLTTGQTDNGGEGQRFMGYTVYDALINWDLSSATKPSDLVPGLAAQLGTGSGGHDEDPLDLQDTTRRAFPRRLGVHRRPPRYGTSTSC